MLRWTVCLAVLAAMFASTTELEAQRRAPLRNLMRSVGHGWGSGYHDANPGHDSSYYSPWSEQNTWQGEGQIINQNQTPTIQLQTTPNQTTPATEPNSASYLLNQPSTIQKQIIHNPHYRSGNTTTTSTRSTITDQTRIIQQQQINQLKPYHSKNTSSTAIELNHGGEFQVPANDTGWDSYRYNQEFNNSQPFSPRK